ncbi:MAG: glycoside hydrolase family 2, partial [Verrucomicrobiaceae bacterium]
MKEEIQDFGFTKEREEAEAVGDRKKALPRAVIRSNFYQLLDGKWRFAHDPEDRGLSEGWARGHAYRHTVSWPGSIEQHLAEIQEARHNQPKQQWNDSVVAWYECDFFLPSAVGGTPGTLLQLTFGACGYETRVWLNGILLRTIEGAEAHLGEYNSFSYELPAEVLHPSNRLTVRISASMDAELPRGKQESHVYKRGGIWYQTFTGAVRSVWLETVERNRLRSRVAVMSVVEDQLVRFDFTTRIHDAGAYNLHLRIYEHQASGAIRSEPVAQADFPLKLEAGEKFQRVVVELPGARLWSPSHPDLYLLVAQLIDADGNAAQIETQFGLRRIETRGRFVYLNNRPVYLDGILYQPGTATYEEMRRHMHAMKKLGCNLVRIHIAGIDPRICSLADETGLMLWVEVPSPHTSSPRSRENHYAELKRMLALIGSHPSVVIWSLYNEDWGVQDIATNRSAREYITDTYHYMRIHHPHFLVVDNDGWHHVSWEGRLKSDLLTAHLYTPDVERWRDLLGRLAQGKLEKVAVNPLVIGDPYFHRGQVP